MLIARTVLPHLWSANQQADQHGRSRLEVYKEGAGCVRLPHLTKAKRLPAVASEVCLTSNLDLYACHHCKGGLNLHSDQENLAAGVRAVLQLAACTATNMRHHRDAPQSRRCRHSVRGEGRKYRRRRGQYSIRLRPWPSAVGERGNTLNLT